MKLDKNSVLKILGTNTEIIVYGMHDCKYHEIATMLAHMDFNASTAVTTQLEQLNYSESNNPVSGCMGALCKNILSSLIAENYKRVKENKPIIVLIFCIGFESSTENRELNVKYAAKEHVFMGSITNKELRRCYKLCTETDWDIKQIALQTFKFVKIKQDLMDVYSLEELHPFWKSNLFQEAWKIRLSNPNRPSQIIAKNTPKQYQWKNELTLAITLFGNSKINNELGASLDVEDNKSKQLLRLD